MRLEESVPAPRGWTGKAAFEGAGASLLLHLFVGAAVVVALSGAPKSTPLVVDLTLLPPAGIDRHPTPPIFAAAKPATVRERSDLPEPSSLPALPERPVLPAAANPSDVTAAAIPSGPEADGTVPASPPLPAAASPATGWNPFQAGAGRPTEKQGARFAAADFARVRDAIQKAIAYPATARRMGWEGKVVVAFHLLPDGSVRDVRVVQGSGHAALDRGAIEAVRNASPFPRPPVEAEVITPVVYRLTAR